MTTRNLSLTDVSAPAGSGCACCATPTDTAAPPSTVAASTAGGVITTYGVAGMTCGHCVGAVTSGLETLDGVRSVDITLVAAGTSRVTVHSTDELDDAAVGAAVEGAGYDLTGRLG